MAEKPTYEELEQRVRDLEQLNSAFPCAEKLLQDSEEKFKKLADYAPVQISIIALEDETRYLYVNREWEKVIGYTKDEVEFVKPIDIVHPDMQQTVLQKAQKRLNGHNVPERYELRVVTKSKENKTLDFSAVPITYDNKQAILTTAIDLTERKQAEEALGESERRFQRMLGVVPDMISIHSPEMDILYSNWQGFGAVPETMRKTNTKCYRTYRGHTDICPDCLARTVLETGKPLREEARLPDGTWVDLRVIPLLDKNNNVEMFMEWVRDITDRKQDEETLRESKETLRTTLDSIGDAVISTDMDGLVAAMNPVAESLTGWSEKEAVGRPLETVFRIVNEQTRQPIESPVANVLRSDHIVGLANHTLLIAADGREIPIADSGAPIRNDAGEITGVVLVFRDQTEERKARKALESNYGLLRIAGETARFGGWSVDLEKNICTWSDAVADIHDVPRGYAPPLQEGISFYAPEWREKIAAVFTACAQRGIPYDAEMEIITQKKRRVWVRTTGRAIRNEEDKIITVQGSFQDITERKHAEEALKKSEASLKEAQRLAEIGNWSWSLRTGELSMSDQMYDIIGLERTPDALDVAAHEKYYTPESWQRFRSAVETARVTGKPYEIELEVVRESGPSRHVVARGEVLKDENGQVEVLRGTLQDITERKQHEERIEHLMHVLRAIRDVNQLITHETERGELLRQSCETLISTRGYRSAWSVLRDADGALESVAESGLDDDFAFVRRAMQQGEWPNCCRQAWEHPDGVALIRNPARTCKTCALSHTYHGTVALAGALRHGSRDYGVLVVVLPAGLADDPEEQSLFRELVGDIGFALYTIESREVLAEQEIRFQELADSLPQVVFEIDRDGRFIYVNTRAFGMFGYTQQDLDAGLNAFQMFIPENRDRVSRNIARVMAGEELGGIEYTALRKDQSPFPVVIYSTRILRDGRVVGLRGLVVDVTDQKRAQETRRKLELQLLQAQKMESVGRLAGGVAHDFNNMLGVIIGNAELARDRLPPDDPLHADLMEILDAAQRSTDITRQLLAFASRQTIDPKEIDLNETVESMLKMLRRLIGEDIHLSWQPGSRRMPVLMDPSQLDQLLANLCINARDAIGGVGKLTIETGRVRFDEEYCAEHAGFIPGEFILLAVSDDGCGMDKETLGNIFEPFFTTKGVGKGTGLGLSTVFGIVKQNNGFIYVYSEPDKGTTFKIYLPPCADKDTGLKDQKTTDIPAGHGETVLIVEDEASILKLAQRILERLGYLVLTAATPGEAMTLAEAHAGEIHLLITDVVMPEMNGRELAENLQIQYSDLKVLFMSGYTANVIAHRGVLEGGVHFIQKPFSNRDLAVKVREVL